MITRNIKKGWEVKLHRAISIGDDTSFISGEMIRRRVRVMVELIQSVTDRVVERMVYRTATLVPNSALVKSY